MRGTTARAAGAVAAVAASVLLSACDYLAPPTTLVTVTVPATSSAKPPPPTTVAATAPRTPALPKGFAAVYRQVSSGVARVDVGTCDGPVHGSGFLVSPRLLVTNQHVVDGWTSVRLTFGEHGDAGSTRGTVVAFDEEQDLALVRLAEMSSNRFVFGAASGRVPSGMAVATIGFPLDQPMSMASGIVSGTGRSIDAYTDLVQTDIELNPGNSGGPVLSETGDLVGVAVATRRDSVAISYAIPGTLAHERFLDWRGRTHARGRADCSVQPDPVDASGGYPVAPDPADPVGPTWRFVVGDAFLGGVWLRSDELEGGRLPGPSSPPPNAVSWAPNSTTLVVECARAAASYPVRWADGRRQTWRTWFRTDDGTWFPSAVANGVRTDGLHGLPTCD